MLIWNQLSLWLQSNFPIHTSPLVSAESSNLFLYCTPCIQERLMAMLTDLHFPRNFGLYSTGFDHPNVNRIKNSRDQIAPYIHGCDLAPSCSNFHPLCIPIGVSITRNTIRVSCLYKLSTSHKQRLLEFRLNKMILVPKESLLVFVQVLQSCGCLYLIHQLQHHERQKLSESLEVQYSLPQCVSEPPCRSRVVCDLCNLQFRARCQGWVL